MIVERRLYLSSCISSKSRRAESVSVATTSRPVAGHLLLRVARCISRNARHRVRWSILRTTVVSACTVTNSPSGTPGWSARELHEETGLVAILRKPLNNEDEARALIRQLFVSTGDIIPCAQTKSLTVKIHHMAKPAQDKAIEKLLEELTRMEFNPLETGAKLIYALV